MKMHGYKFGASTMKTIEALKAAGAKECEIEEQLNFSSSMKDTTEEAATALALLLVRCVLRGAK